MSITYLASHATHSERATDWLAMAARDLKSSLDDVRGIRTAFPTQAQITRFNSQQLEVASLIQRYVDLVHKEAEAHGLEEDRNGEVIRCDGFDCRSWRLPSDD